MKSNNLNYQWSDSGEPHLPRTREIIKKYPEIKNLFGPTPVTAPLTVAIVALQFFVAYSLRDLSIWWAIAAAWLIGAVCEHALFVVIHDCSHNLAFKSAFSNKVLSLVANLPGAFPSAIGFRNFHLLHHSYQGEMDWDADLAGPKEAAFVGNSSFKKALWFFFFPLIEAVVRPMRVTKVKLFEPWALWNLATTVGAFALVWYFWGGMSAFYLVASTWFSVGLHPLGGRWIQEHYIVKPGQETYSYYGPLNLVALNVGYHNEHHDFMYVPWTRLRKIKHIAREYYDNLYSHKSWTGLWLRFIFDPSLSLYSRVIRQDHRERRSTFGTKDTQAYIDNAKSGRLEAPASL